MPTPGPPKRFAQAMGAALLTVAAFGCAIAGVGLVAAVLAVIVVVFAVLESGLGFCAGCQIFALLMRMGIIPQSVCEGCANLPLRWRRATP